MKYEYWLASLKGISDKKKLLLKTYMKSADAVYHIEETEIAGLGFLNEQEQNTIRQAKKTKEPEAEWEALGEKGIRFISCYDPAYPNRLRHIPDFPYAIYVKGSLPEETVLSAAVVGARRSTPYGEKYACKFTGILAGAGVQIISGMARGIDGLAQREALKKGGKTFAVLGNGVDICYPREHIGLYEDILAGQGGILSELPPGIAPLSWHFPRRNRIISGLSDAVFVMEARRRSGSLITAELALEQGKDIYALPGPLDSPSSSGCNWLIHQGATPLLTPELLLKEMGISGDRHFDSEENAEEPEKVLERKEELVYSSLDLSPKSVTRIAEELGHSVREILQVLSALEIQGYIRQVSRGYYIRI